MMEAHDRFYLEETDFHRTIAIDPLGVRTTEFDLSRERGAEAVRLRTRRRREVPEQRVGRARTEQRITEGGPCPPESLTSA